MYEIPHMWFFFLHRIALINEHCNEISAKYMI